MRSFNIVCSVLVMAAGIGLAGCAAETAADENVETSESEIVARVDVGYGYITFHKAYDHAGNLITSVMEVSPNDIADTPLSMIAEKHTALELFRAVAPDQAAPQVLVEAHELEAANLERDSDDVLDFDEDRYLRTVARGLGFADEEIQDLTLEILGPEALPAALSST